MNGRNILIVITGATASGKSRVAVEVASQLGCEVISADSRQIYRDIPIVSAAPTPLEMQGIPHHFIGILPLEAYYSAARFESDVLALLPRLWENSPYAIMCGGSMMYIDAVTDGIDLLPDISPEIRSYVGRLLSDHGPRGLMAQLEILDPVYAAQVDPANTKRIAHAVEISLAAGEPYSGLRKGTHKARPFEIIKIVIDRPRQELFQRINRRVNEMISKGLIEEARALYPLRHLNSLNTVGLKELFEYFDDRMSLETALARIAKNTRVYAKKQLTWLSRPGIRPSIHVNASSAVSEIIHIIDNFNKGLSVSDTKLQQ